MILKFIDELHQMPVLCDTLIKIINWLNIEPDSDFVDKLVFLKQHGYVFNLIIDRFYVYSEHGFTDDIHNQRRRFNETYFVKFVENEYQILIID